MQTLSRRDFLRVSSLVAASSVVAACGQPATTPTTGPTEATSAPAAATAAPQPTAAQTQPTVAAQPTAEPVSRFKEAPMLAEMVAAGKLPPVDERLPENPAICPVQEMNGKFGGIIRRGYQGVSDRTGPTKMQECSLTWFNMDLTMRTEMAESWEVNEDASEWTFKLRKGARWSDGAPLTSAAFTWFWENELKNPELTAAPPRNWATGNPLVLAELEAPDDYTVVFKFAEPNPLFVYRPSRSQPFTPGHYLEQFHPAFADKDALDKQVKELGLNAWTDLYDKMADWAANPARPCAGPWTAENELGAELFVMVRNPYFWETDSDGQQLPYVDKIQHRLFEQVDVFNMWIINGEIDFQRRKVNIGNYTLFKENEANGDYQIHLSPQASHLALHMNMTTKKQKLRQIFQDRRFRIAVSYAINREEINELVFDGMCTPRQYSPDEGSPQYYPKLSNAYIEYDPAKANALLDEMGLTERDAEGFRKYNDGSGEIISFIFEQDDQPGSPNEDAAQMVSRNLADVGIKATYKYFERSLKTQHYEVNEVEAGWAGGDRSILPIVTPWIFLGTQSDRQWALAWGLWRNSNGTDPNGEEPPKDHWIWKIWEYGDQMNVEVDDQKRNEIFWKICDIWVEELPCVGVLGMFPSPCIKKTTFRNWLAGLPSDDLLRDECLQNPQTYFWEDPENHQQPTAV